MPSLTDTIINSFPSGAYCFPAFLEIVEIVETTEVPTAAVECAGRPRLRINPEWVAQHANTPEKLVMLILHELHHVILGHTRLYSRVTPIDNLVFDAVINAMLCHLFPDPPYTALFRSTYRLDRFPECFLRPPEDWTPGAAIQIPRALLSTERGDLAMLYTALYHSQRVTYDQLREALSSRQADEEVDMGRLLGDHRAESGGASSAGDLESRAPALLQRVRDIVEGWPQPPHPITGLSYDAMLRRQWIKPAPPTNREVLSRLIRAVARRSLAGRAPETRFLPREVESPLPSLDRRAGVLRQLRVCPMLFRGQVPARQRGAATEPVHLYLDVSGSIGELKRDLYGAVLSCRELVHPAIHLFSTTVADVSLLALALGECRTTGGTDIQCVADHMAANRVSRAVIITDGQVGQPQGRGLDALRSARIAVALTPNDAGGYGSTHEFMKDYVNHFGQLRPTHKERNAA